MIAMKYCDPLDKSPAGIREVCRRLAALNRCLDININGAVVRGNITVDLQHFSRALRTKLESEGWSFSYDGSPRLKVRPPGHAQPFPVRSVLGTKREP